MINKIWLPLVAKLGNLKFGNPIFQVMPKNISITFWKNIAIRWAMV